MKWIFIKEVNSGVIVVMIFNFNIYHKIVNKHIQIYWFNNRFKLKVIDMKNRLYVTFNRMIRSNQRNGSMEKIWIYDTLINYYIHNWYWLLYHHQQWIITEVY